MMRGLSDLNNSGGGGGGVGGSGGGGCADCLKGIWAKTPFWTRSLLFISLVIYLSGWITMSIEAVLICAPAEVIYNFGIWRLLTGLYVHPQLMTFLFCMLSHLPHAAIAE